MIAILDCKKSERDHHITIKVTYKKFEHLFICSSITIFSSNMRFFYSHITCKHLKMRERDTSSRKCIFELTFTSSKSNYLPLQHENRSFSLFEFFFIINSLSPKAILLEAIIPIFLSFEVSMDQFYIYYILVVTTPFNFSLYPPLFLSIASSLFLLYIRIYYHFDNYVQNQF